MNTVISPMITWSWNGKYGIPEELNPFYLGNTGAVYAGYRTSITVGSSFIVMHKEKGINISTARNRSQQLIFLNLRFGIDSIRNVSLNVAEDYLVTDNSLGQTFADNWDRYYTGGGNLQVRLNSYTKLKLYTEVYIGASYPDRFDNPDLIKHDRYIGGKSKLNRFFAGPKRMLRLAVQELGQKMLNTGRTLFAIDYRDPNGFIGNKNTTFFIGTQGGLFNMWFQNLVHNGIAIDKAIPSTTNPQNQMIDRNNRDRYHRFMPQYRTKKDLGRLLIGIGMAGSF